MSDLLRKLLAFLRVGVGGEGDDSADPPADDASADPTLEDLADLDAQEPDEDAAAAGDEDAAPAKPNRTRQLEQDLEYERRARADAERRAQAAPPPQPRRDPAWDAEEAEIAKARADGATPEQMGWLQWKVDNSRRIRQSEAQSQNALFQAADLSDRTEFTSLRGEKPKLYKAYADRVEEVLRSARQNGLNPKRLAIMDWLIGQDVRTGKITPSKKTPKVDRGEMPKARTDVRAKGSLTEHQKRTARLENQRI